jgi:hypothetical protein
MSPEFEDWCKKELPRFNGNGDVTIAHFLMSLDNPQDVRDYCGAYLGANGREFADDFLERRRLEHGMIRGTAKVPQPVPAQKASVVKGKKK